MPPKKKDSPTKGAKDAKKQAENQALKEQQDKERADVFTEEDRDRVDIVATERTARRELKTLRRAETAKYLVSLDRTIASLNAKVAEVTKTTGLQIVKLEDELARLSMSKEVIVQENIMLKKEASELKSDDASKQMIAQLSSRIKQLEAERNAKTIDYEETLGLLNRKLAKQISENRLMRIQQKDVDAEWAMRISRFEDSVVDALDKLIASTEEPPTGKLALFNIAVEKSKREYLAALRDAKAKLSFSNDLVDIKSMHSNISARIKTRLQELSHEELMLVIEALSFEESVVQYLEAKWPDDSAFSVSGGP